MKLLRYITGIITGAALSATLFIPVTFAANSDIFIEYLDRESNVLNCTAEEETTGTTGGIGEAGGLGSGTGFGGSSGGLGGLLGEVGTGLGNVFGTVGTGITNIITGGETNDGKNIDECPAQKIRITVTAKNLEGLENILDNTVSGATGTALGGGLGGTIGGTTGGVIGGVAGGFLGESLNSILFQEGSGITLEKPGIAITIASEQGNIFTDLMDLDINGLTSGVPTRWYVEEFEVWNKDNGERYKFPTLSIPITKGIIHFDIKEDISGEEIATSALEGGIAGGVIGGITSGGGIGGIAGGTGIGAGIEAVDDLTPTIPITLNIDNNYIEKIIVPEKIEKERIKGRSTTNFIREDSVSMKLEFANGVQMNAIVLGDVMEFSGSSRKITKEGLSSFDPTEIQGLSQESSLLTLIVLISNWVLGFVGALAVIILIYGGFVYVTAGGDDAQVSKATNVIKYAVIGIIIIVASFAIVNTLIRFTGGTYQASFEIRDASGGRIIGSTISQGNCLTTTLPLTGKIDICNEGQFLTVTSDSPLLPKLIWPLQDIQKKCADLKVGAFACLDAPNGEPIKFLMDQN